MSTSALRLAIPVGVVVLLAAGFSLIRFLEPAPRYRAGRPEALQDKVPLLTGPAGYEAYLVREGTRIIAIEPRCAGDAAGESCRAEWNTESRHFECECTGRTYDILGKSLSQNVSRTPPERQSLKAPLQEGPLRREEMFPVAEPSGSAKSMEHGLGFGIGSKDTGGNGLSLRRHRVTLAPNGEIMVDRNVLFDEPEWIKPGADLILVPESPPE